MEVCRSYPFFFTRFRHFAFGHRDTVVHPLGLRTTFEVNQAVDSDGE